MKKKNKNLTVFTLFFLTVLFFFKSADAYVLQGQHLLKLMADALGKTKSLQVSQKLILYQTPDGDNAIELKETLRYQYPDLFRSDIVTDSAQRIHVLSKGTPLIIVDQKITADYETDFDLYKDILFYHKRPELEKKLTSRGIDVTVSSIGRFQGRIGYIIGGEYPDESVPEIWLDKETFRPFRWLLKGNSSEDASGSLEIRYSGWREKEKIWYPRKIEFYRDDSLVRTIQVDKIKIGPRFKSKLFDIKYLKSIYPLETPILQSQEENEENNVGEIQKTLDEFNKIFE